MPIWRRSEELYPPKPIHWAADAFGFEEDILGTVQLPDTLVYILLLDEGVTTYPDQFHDFSVFSGRFMVFLFLSTLPPFFTAFGIILIFII
nr:hypothetical protein [Clostridium sp. cel8]